MGDGIACERGRAPALAARPLGYRLRDGFSVIPAAISIKTTVAIFFASFDVRTRTNQSTVYSSDPAGLPNGVRRSRGADPAGGYAAKSFVALASSMLSRFCTT